MPSSRLLRFYAAIPVALLCVFGLLAVAISQETSVGSLRGRVVIQETGNPVPLPVFLYPVTPKDGGKAQYETQSAADGSFSFRNLPVGTYKLEINGKAHSMQPVDVQIVEGETQQIEAELVPGSPTLDLYVHQHIFTPDERPRVTAKGFVDADDLSLKVYRVDQDAFLTKSSRDLQGLLGIESYYGDGQRPTADLSGNPSLSLAESRTVPITTRDLEGVFIQRVTLPRLAPGLYVADLRAGNLQQVGWVMVTSLGLVTKSAGSDILAYTVDLKTGKPLSADVTAYDGSKVIASGTTSADGLLSLTRPSRGGESNVTTVARKGDSFAFVSSWFSSMEEASRHVYAYTDRPVYRPGQRVFFKGITRQSRNDGYVVPPSQPVTVEVRDPNDTLIYRGTARTDRFGAWSGSFGLNPETASGYYTLVSSVDGGRGQATDFQVMSYRKPEFSVKVEFPRKQYVRGETVRAKISADYYFGAPVANAKVSCMIYRSPYWIWGDEEEMEEYYGGEYEDYGGYGETVKEVQVRTDANGEAEIEFPADWEQPEENDAWDSDQEFTVEASVTDGSDRMATGNGSIIATRGDFSVEVQPDRYVVEPGASVNLAIRAVDYDKRPVRDQEVTVQIGLHEWTERGGYHFRQLRRQRVTTDADGRASMRVKIERPGDLQITARTRDRRGNNIVGSASIWSYSGAYQYGGGRLPDLQIVTDKKTYDAGDTASVLIKTDNPGATALVTVEGERVYDRMTVPLTGSATMVKIPVKSAYKPNFHIGVCFVKDKEFSQQQARAKVSLNPQTLKIAVQPNKRQYRPGENASFKIKATDQKGNPAVAQVSVGVVDEAIYAIAEDRTTPILDHFYARRPNHVQTSFSFPEIYLSDPDKAGAPSPNKPIRTRKRFMDTAFWAPTVVTDAQGEASVSFRMPDNLTTWRTTVRGITTGTSCGQSVSTVLARQDFMVRLQMPRFMVQTDTATLTTSVHNDTGRSQRVSLSLKAPGLTIAGRSTRSITVADGKVQRIDWRVSAPSPGTFPVTIRAAGQTDGDAMELELPVYPHGVEHTVLDTGTISGTKTERKTITVRGDSIPEVTKLRIRLAPSLAASMLGSLDYLAQYPYGCTEQTTSSFIPDVVLSRSLRELGMRNPSLEAKLPDMVEKGLFRLYRFQLEDGGWSWCQYGTSDPWMTAYVSYGLVMARNAGFPVNENVLNRGLGRLAQHVTGREDGQPWSSALRNGSASSQEPPNRISVGTRAFSLYVLTLAGQNRDQELASIAGRNDLDSESLALLTLSYARLGQSGPAAALLDRLFAGASTSSGMIHWTDNSDYYGNNVEVTALGLQALMAVSPDDPRAFEIVRWLMRERRGDAWYSTRDTAMVLYAMSEFLKHTQELSPDSDISVLINGKTVATTHLGSGSVLNPEFQVTVSSRELRKGRNDLQIRKTGEGNLYYTTHFTQWAARDSIPATVTGAGVTVSRAYFKPPARYYQSSGTGLGSPVRSCRPGDILLVRLTVTNRSPLRQCMIEDFVPAGCEIIDKGEMNIWEWSYWWVGQDIRDERISFYADELSAGKHVIEYQMRAGFEGTYHALPAQIFAMYEPSIRSTSAETEFTIR